MTPGDQQVGSPPAPRWQALRGLLLSILLSVLSLGFLLFFSPTGDIILSFQRLQPAFLGLALGARILVWTIEALRVSSLAAAAGSFLPYGDAFRAVLAGDFLLNIMPFHSGAGLMYTYVISRRGLGVPRAAATVIGGSFLSQLFQGLLLAAVALNPLHRNLLPPPVKGVLGSYLGGLVLVVILAVMVLVSRLPAASARPFTSVPLLKRLAGPAGELIAGIRTLAGSGPAGLLPLLVYTALYYCAYYAISWFLLAAVGVHVSLSQLITIQLLIFIVMAVMPTPGGSGGMELGAAYLFSHALEPAVTTIFIILWRFLTFYLSLAVGGFVLFTFLPDWWELVRNLTGRRR